MTEERHNLIFINLKTLNYIRDKFFRVDLLYEDNQQRNNHQVLYLRITVDGVRKETSTKRTWVIHRWDPKTERATGNKEYTRTLNHFLDAMVTRINQFKMHPW